MYVHFDRTIGVPDSHLSSALGDSFRDVPKSLRKLFGPKSEVERFPDSLTLYTYLTMLSAARMATLRSARPSRTLMAVS